MRFKKLLLVSVIIAIFAQLSIAQTNISLLRACYQSSAADYDNTAHLVTDGNLGTRWISKSNAVQWIYVDLGKVCSLSKLNINWGTGFARNYSIQISSDGLPEKPANWHSVYNTLSGSGGNEEINLKGIKARYVKINCTQPSEQKGYSIKEIKIMGKGRLVYVNTPNPTMRSDGKQYLTGGNWTLQRASLVAASGVEISQLNYKNQSWIPATVPGTILTSYYNIGAIPDHNYGDQQLMISDSFFTADFWYRNNFIIPKSYQGKQIWLNFDGINWKAEIFINGHSLGNINGAFIRGKFDVSPFVKAGESNAIAVLVHKNDNPGQVTEQHLFDADNNGGIIGYDGPTFLASIGWNWMPTIRGRNTGIWSDVYLNATDAVTINNPFIKTDLPLPDTSKANITIETTVKNNTNNMVSGLLKGMIGKVSFEQLVSLEPNEAKLIELNSITFPQLSINHPQLWWPNGYGNQSLQQLNLEFQIDGLVSDKKELEFGIREYTYCYENNNLNLHVNGYPVIIRGGNWGMSEAMLRCDKEGYDLRVKLHKDMNLNMIRNWIGMVGDDAFYEACDKYGIMVWDDFWLANPVDGPPPIDTGMFMANVKDKIYRRRNNASVALWCGRNEGYPPAALDSAMKVETFNLDGTRHYISSSADRPVTGLGPYETKDAKWYFKNRGTTFHSEQGIVAVPSVESMKAMMPADSLWPISDMWGKHDWTQPRVTIYNDDLNRQYGKALSLVDFCKKAQMMNMEGPKAMMETWQSNRGPGVLVWMTHPAWPSLICQTYDYFFEPTAAYYAFKKASEPVHVLWRADNEQVELANNTRLNLENVTVETSVYGIDGRVIFNKSIKVNVTANSTKSLMQLTYPTDISPVHFISLKLTDAEGKILSDNFYWRATQYLNYTALQAMPQINLSANATKSSDKGGQTIIKVLLKNNNAGIALMCRLKVLQNKSGKRVLPAFFSDNYVSFAPGESRIVNITFDNKYLDNETPRLMIEGWNLDESEISIK